jgi:hypothetical protein
MEDIKLWKSPIKKARKSFDLGPFSAPNRVRTGDLLIKSQAYITKRKKPIPVTALFLQQLTGTRNFNFSRKEKWEVVFRNYFSKIRRIFF